jgi:hypothetical protein
MTSQGMTAWRGGFGAFFFYGHASFATRDQCCFSPETRN